MHGHYFASLQESEGYQSQDLIVLHPQIPNLDGLLEKFAAIHTHDDDEVRYIVEGEGTFGFVLAQIQMYLRPQRCIGLHHHRGCVSLQIFRAAHPDLGFEDGGR